MGPQMQACVWPPPPRLRGTALQRRRLSADRTAFRDFGRCALSGRCGRTGAAPFSAPNIVDFAARHKRFLASFFIHLALPLFSTVKVPCQSAACLYNLRTIANSYRKVTILKDTPEKTARKSPLQNAAGFSIIKPDFAAAVPAALPILLFILEILRTLLILERRLFL